MGPTEGEAVAVSALGQRDAAWTTWRDLPRPQRLRVGGCVIYLALLTLLFIQPLTRLMLYAAESELYSYILLVPLIAGYLLFVQRRRRPLIFCSSLAGTLAF